MMLAHVGRRSPTPACGKTGQSAHMPFAPPLRILAALFEPLGGLLLAWLHERIGLLMLICVMLGALNFHFRATGPAALQRGVSRLGTADGLGFSGVHRPGPTA